VPAAAPAGGCEGTLLYFRAVPCAADSLDQTVDLPVEAVLGAGMSGQAEGLPAAARRAERSAPAKIAIIAAPTAANPTDSASQAQFTIAGPV